MARAAWYWCLGMAIFANACTNAPGGEQMQGNDVVSDVPLLVDILDAGSDVNVDSDTARIGDEVGVDTTDLSDSDEPFGADLNNDTDSDVHSENDIILQDMLSSDTQDAGDAGADAGDAGKLGGFSATLSGPYNDTALDVAWLSGEQPVVVGYSTMNLVGKRVGFVWKGAKPNTQLKNPPVWAIELAGSTEISAVVVRESNDLALFGSTIGPNGPQAWSARTHGDGKLLWQKRWDNMSWGISDAALLETGHVVVVGNTGGDTAQCAVMSLDDNGEVVWARHVGGTYMDSCEAVTSIPGGFVTAGWTNSFHDGPWCGASPCRDGWVVGWNVKGEPLWQQRVVTDGTLTLVHIVRASSKKGFWAVGNITSANESYSDVIVLRLDDDGHLTWHSRMALANSDVAEAVSATEDGAIVVGRAGFADAGGVLWALRFDDQGSLLWQRAVGKGFGDAAFAATKQEGSDKIVLAGWTTSFFDTKGTDAWLFQVQGDFELPAECSGPTFFDTMGSIVDVELTLVPSTAFAEVFVPTYVSTQAVPYELSTSFTDHCFGDTP
ncbi:MAG: hypothetical protein HUU55_11520 [Myxococcales bacterium]|nr:hypothetical protein [Myxococcales bacterium]